MHLPTGEILAKHKTILTSRAVTSVKVGNYFMYFFLIFLLHRKHFSTIQRTGVFSKWLFSTNKFLYVNTTQNVYEHVKKINFVACGLLRLSCWRAWPSDDASPICLPDVGSDLWNIHRMQVDGIGAARFFGKEMSHSCWWMSTTRCVLPIEQNVYNSMCLILGLVV